MREIQSAGVCELRAAPNQHRNSQVQVCDTWWPYCRVTDGSASEPADGVPAERAYVARIRQLLGEASCVQGGVHARGRASGGGLVCPWHPVRERTACLAAGLHAEVIRIGRPCPSAEPIRSLRSFVPVLEEVLAGNFPPDFWSHLEFNLGRCEEHWRRNPGTAPGRARPNLEQAKPPPASSGRAERSKTG